MDTKPDNTPALARGLAGYVRAVAAAINVPAEGTGFEISDTATAYLGLARRWSEHPDRDLMLVWSEQHGWLMAVETDPTEAPIVLAYLPGSDLVPSPDVVARFVTDVVSNRHRDRFGPIPPIVDNRDDLAAQLDRYVIDPR